jgi:phosphate transport system substrate-binding protein
VRTRHAASALVVAAGLLAGCSGVTSGPTGGPLIRIDGSGTLYPLTEAVAEEVQNKNQDLRVTVGASGTGSGFRRFCRGEIDVADASRPIDAAETDACARAGIPFLELPVAYDGIVVAVSAKNAWAGEITVSELKALYELAPQGKSARWSALRPGWPDREIRLYGPAPSSGTFEYFTAAVVGSAGASRAEVAPNADPGARVRGVAADEAALGVFGYQAFEQNRDALRALAIDDGRDEDGKGPIPPTPETVRDGTYQPLSRPLLIYVSARAIGRAEVRAFVEYYLKEGPWLADQVGAIQLGDRGHELVRQRLARGTTGSLFSGGLPVGLTLGQLLAKLP